MDSVNNLNEHESPESVQDDNALKTAEVENNVNLMRNGNEGGLEGSPSQTMTISDEKLTQVSKSFAHKKKTKFSLFDAALACMTFVVLNFVFMFAFAFVPASLRTVNSPTIFIASFLIEALFGVAAWIVAKASRVDLIQASCMNKKISWKMIWLGFVIAIGSLVLFGGLTFVYSDFLINLGYKPQDLSIKIDNFGIYLIYVFISCLVPAFFEDLLFRGVILSGFKKYKETTAIVLSSLIFMVMHGNAEQTVHQFIVGMVLAYLFVKSKNLWLGVIVHFFNNFISVTLTFVTSIMSQPETLPEETITPETVTNPWFTWVIELIIFLLIAAAGYFIIVKLANKMIAESDKVNGNAQNTLATDSQTGAEVSAQTEENHKSATEIASEYLGELTGEPVLNENNVSETTTETIPNENLDKENVTESQQTEEKTEETVKSVGLEDDATAKVELVQTEDTLKDEITTETENVENGGENIESLDSTNEVLSMKKVEEKTEGSKKMATALLFLFSNGYLILEWLLSLINGFFQ